MTDRLEQGTILSYRTQNTAKMGIIHLMPTSLMQEKKSLINNKHIIGFSTSM